MEEHTLVHDIRHNFEMSLAKQKKQDDCQTVCVGCKHFRGRIIIHDYGKDGGCTHFPRNALRSKIFKKAN